jgi:hypothetical protein
LSEAGSEVFDDFLGENAGIVEIVGFFKPFVPESEDTEAGLLAVQLLILLFEPNPTARTQVISFTGAERNRWCFFSGLVKRSEGVKKGLNGS